MKTVKEDSIENGLQTYLFRSIDLTTPYIEFVKSQIDLEAINKARLKVVFNPMYGTARGIPRSYLAQCWLRGHDYS